jgi:hypothetical protein
VGAGADWPVRIGWLVGGVDDLDGEWVRIKFFALSLAFFNIAIID